MTYCDILSSKLGVVYVKPRYDCISYPGCLFKRDIISKWRPEAVCFLCYYCSYRMLHPQCHTMAQLRTLRPPLSCLSWIYVYIQAVIRDCLDVLQLQACHHVKRPREESTWLNCPCVLGICYC